MNSIKNKSSKLLVNPNKSKNKEDEFQIELRLSKKVSKHLKKIPQFLNLWTMKMTDMIHKVFLYLLFYLINWYWQIINNNSHYKKFVKFIKYNASQTDGFSELGEIFLQQQKQLATVF